MTLRGTGSKTTSTFPLFTILCNPATKTSIWPQTPQTVHPNMPEPNKACLNIMISSVGAAACGQLRHFQTWKSARAMSMHDSCAHNLQMWILLVLKSKSPQFNISSLSCENHICSYLFQASHSCKNWKKIYSFFL